MKAISHQTIFNAPFGLAYLKIVPDINNDVNNFLLLNMNRAFAQILNIDESVASGQVLNSLCNLSFDIDVLYREVRKTGRKQQSEFYSKETMGWYKVELFSEDDMHLSLLLTNIDDQKLIRKHFEDLALVAAHTTDVVIITDKHRRITWVNEPFTSLTGYTLADVMGRIPGDVLQGKDTSEKTRDQIRQALALSRPVQVEVLNYSKSGRAYWLDLKIDPVFDAEGEVQKFIAIEREITERKKSEEALYKSEIKYRNIFDNVQDVFYQTDLNGIVIEISPSIKRYSGYELDEILGKPISAFYYNPEDRIALLSLLMQNKEVTDYEIALKAKDGRKVYSSVNCHLLYDEFDRVVGVEGSLRDISIRIKADWVKKIQFKIATATVEAKELTSFVEIIRQHLSEYMDTSNFFVALYDKSKGMLSSPFFKDEYEDVSEWPAERSLTGRVIQLNKAMLLSQSEIDALICSGDVISMGETAKSWLGVPLRFDGDAIGAFVIQSYTAENAYSEDVLELLEFVSNQLSIAIRRKKDEEEITLLSKAVSQSPVSVVITDTKGMIEYVNPKFSEVTGYSAEDALGCKTSIMKSGRMPDEVYANLWSTIQSGHQWTGELLNKKQNGELFWEFASISPIYDNSGKIYHYVAVKEDITVQKKSVDKMIDLTSRMTSLIANLPGGILMETPQRKIQQANKKFCELFGIPVSPEELIGLDCAATSEQAKMLFVNPDGFIPRIGDIIREGTMVLNEELDLVDGRVFQRDFIPIRTVGNEVEILWHYRDITNRKIASMALEKQAALQQVLMDISTKYINLPLSQIDEAIMESLSKLAIFVQADRVYIFDYKWDKCSCQNTHEWCAPGAMSYENASIGISEIDFPEWIEAHRNGKSVIIDNTNDISADNALSIIWKTHHVKSLIAIPMMDDGKCVGFVGFDFISESHSFSETEEMLLFVYAEMLVNVRHRESLERKLIEEKGKADIANTAKSEFLANMSHEIRTPLNGVIGFTDLLTNTPLTTIQKQYVDNANTSAHALLGIINDILDFSKIEAGKLELDSIKTDLIELMEQTSDIVKFTSAKKGLELLLNIKPGIPRFAVVDPVRLKQIIVNLLSNAVKFTEEGEVELKVDFKQIDESTGEFHFTVRDTGIGISEEQQGKLFKAFSQADSSTTRRFGGTGLGLVISNLLAEKMGSRIKLQSKLGEGTTFYFSIEAKYEVGERLSYESLINMNQVLVIDDNDNNRMILEHTLNNWGIGFTGCDNGISSLKVIEKMKRFDAIIVDYNMPFLNGIDTIKMIREKLNLSPSEQPIILLHSSSDDMTIIEECKKYGVRFNLTKPVKSQELLHYLNNIHRADSEDIPSVKGRSDGFLPEVELNHDPVILIVEDVDLNMQLVTIMIKKHLPNAVLLKAVNGKIAVEEVLKNRPDLVLMDVQMPVMSGLEATVKIREMEKSLNRRTPIVALTAGAIKGERERCLDAGMDDFLTKPLDYVALSRVLTKFATSKFAKENEPVAVEVVKTVSLRFDKDALFDKVGQDKTLYQNLLMVAMQDINRLLSELSEFEGIDDLSVLKPQSHTLKGVCLNMCFNQMAILAKELENSVVDRLLFAKQLGLLKSEWQLIMPLLYES